MERYRNRQGSSGVTRYEIGNDFILVQFGNDATYRYDYQHPGRKEVETMKVLAAKGRGLSTYISTIVRGNYAARLK